MFRLFLPSAFGIVLLALWIYAIFDVIASEESLVRNLPKSLWLMLVIFIPDIGAIAWLALGRPAYAGWRPGDTDYRPARPRRSFAPEDQPDFGSRSAPPPPSSAASGEEARLKAWEEDLRRREAALPPTDAQPPKNPEDPEGFPFKW